MAESLGRLVLERRALLGCAAAAGAIALKSPGVAAAPAPGPATDGLAAHISSTLQRLTPNVWAYVQIQAAGESNLLLSNCGLIAGPTSLLAIDTTAAPLQAQAFRAAAEHATGKSFDRVVITHFHADHVLGLQFFPKIEVIAQEQTAVAMRQMAEGAKPPFWRQRALWAQGDEVYRPVQPTRLYSDRLKLVYGPTDVELFYPGRAHTLGDTIVHLPKERIVFLGDIGFFGVTPLNGSGYVRDWIDVCNRVLAMDIDVIVPGHGPVGGKADLADMRDYLALILAGAQQGLQRGLTPGRAAANIDLGRYRAWSDSSRVAGNVLRIYKELAGSITPATDRAEADAARREYLAITGRSSKQQGTP